MNRRFFIFGVLGLSISASAHVLAQPAPKLISIRKGITSPLLSAAINNPPKREISLEGWLLCNGAEASRSIYRELLKAMGSNAGPGDGVATFNIPNLACEYRSGDDPVKGSAVCWSETRFGFLAGTVMPFDVNQNI
jgi:hypothetical protein